MPQLQGFFSIIMKCVLKKKDEESFKVNMSNKYTQCHLKIISDLCKAEKQL